MLALRGNCYEAIIAKKGLLDATQKLLNSPLNGARKHGSCQGRLRTRWKSGIRSF